MIVVAVIAGRMIVMGLRRMGAVAVRVKDRMGRVRYIGKIEVTEAEMIANTKSEAKYDVQKYSIGYGLCFGQNDTKAICMGILDRTMRSPDPNSPPNDQEFVLYHTEGIEAMGFTNHLKLPHYVTFQSGLSNVRKHAHATAVQVSLKPISPRALMISIADNGRGVARGFDLATLAADGHYGLLGISERVALLEGRLLVQNQQRGGALLQVEIPHPRVEVRAEGVLQ